MRSRLVCPNANSRKSSKSCVDQEYYVVQDRRVQTPVAQNSDQAPPSVAGFFIRPHRIRRPSSHDHTDSNASYAG